MLSLRSVFRPDYECDHGSSFSTFIAVTILIHGSFGQAIAFPNPHLTAIISRSYLPLESATMNRGIPRATTVSPGIECGVDSFLRESSDGQKYCECFENYRVHDARTDRCYRVHTRGPCESGSVFIIRADSMITECVPNPCEMENEVFYQGSCHRLNQQGPCGDYETLMISGTTHQPVCGQGIAFSIAAVPKMTKLLCPSGMRRLGQMCREVF